MSELLDTIGHAEPILTHSSEWASVDDNDLIDVSDEAIAAAASRWRRFEPVLSELFPLSRGKITSPLYLISDGDNGRGAGSFFVKADHELPIAGSVKARGGLYEVMSFAERLIVDEGLNRGTSLVGMVTSKAARDLFAKKHIVVGSTGNLGFAVGLAARGFGFNVEVHMSAEAKAWKKDRLRSIGATVVEYDDDYTAAVTGARESAAGTKDAYFVDDERSVELFLGYSFAASELLKQLRVTGAFFNADKPLFVIIPCGVGGAPGGICLGLKRLLGLQVRTVFVEPVQSPCMMLQFAAGLKRSISVQDAGLSNSTIADGLAVSRASMFVAKAVRHCVDYCVTVSDSSMRECVIEMFNQHNFRLEPAAASGFAALSALGTSSKVDISRSACVVWTTGGSLMPQDEFNSLLRS